MSEATTSKDDKPAITTTNVITGEDGNSNEKPKFSKPKSQKGKAFKGFGSIFGGGKKKDKK